MLMETPSMCRDDLIGAGGEEVEVVMEAPPVPKAASVRPRLRGLDDSSDDGAGGDVGLPVGVAVASRLPGVRRRLPGLDDSTSEEGGGVRVPRGPDASDDGVGSGDAGMPVGVPVASRLPGVRRRLRGLDDSTSEEGGGVQVPRGAGPGPRRSKRFKKTAAEARADAEEALQFQPAMVDESRCQALM